MKSTNNKTPVELQLLYEQLKEEVNYKKPSTLEGIKYFSIHYSCTTLLFLRSNSSRISASTSCPNCKPQNFMNVLYQATVLPNTDRLRAPPALVKGRIQSAKHQANQKGQELTKTSKYAGIQHNMSFAAAAAAVHNHGTLSPLLNIIQLIKLRIPNSQACLCIALIKRIKGIKKQDLMQQKQENIKPGNTLTNCVFEKGQKKDAGRRRKVVVVQAITE